MYNRINDYSLFREDLDHIVGHIDHISNDLRGAHLFITGGTGFFGIWLLESLLYANSRLKLDLNLTVLSRDPARFLASTGRHLADRQPINWIAGSLTGFDPAAASYSHILHLASESNPEGAPDWASRHMTSALSGMQHLIELAVSHKCEALLITTSGAVYGPPEPVINQRYMEGPKGSSDYASEKNVYGQSKRMMETMVAVAAAQDRFRGLIARCFAFVGPYLALDSNYAIGNFMRDAMAGKSIIIQGDGTPLRSYLYSADLIIWLCTILVRGQSGRPYNVGGDVAYSIADLAKLVSDCSGRSVDITIKQQAHPGSPINAYLPNIERSRQELQLEPWIALDEALRRTMAWHSLRQSAD